MVNLSIIFVSFNTQDILKDCLTSIYEMISDKVSFEVIVVDNASKDSSVDMVKKDFAKVILIENQENLGFSKANNLGVKKAKGKYILFLNSDTVLYPNTVETMLAFMDNNPKCGASTCWLEMPNGKLDDAAHRGFPTPWNAFCHFSGLSRIFPKVKLLSGYNLTWMDFSKTHEIDALAGAFMLVRREAGEEAGWWDEDYFFYGEDLDFCFMLKKKGWKIYFVPSVKTLHYKGVSGGLKKESEEITQATHDTKRKATIARFNAMRIFYKKHYEKVYPKFITNLILLGIKIKQEMSLYSLK